MRTHNIPSCYRKSKKSLSCLLTWRYNQPSLARTTPVSRFHGLKCVRAIEVRLYFQEMQKRNLVQRKILPYTKRRSFLHHYVKKECCKEKMHASKAKEKYSLRVLLPTIYIKNRSRGLGTVW